MKRAFIMKESDDSKILVTVWAKYLSAHKYLIEFSQKMVRLIGFGVTVCEILSVEKLQKKSDPVKNTKTQYFKGLQFC